MKTDYKYTYRLVGMLFVGAVFISACGEENSNFEQSKARSQKVTALSTVPALYVGTGGNCGEQSPCYTTIQSAIDAASYGDSVQVLPGEYNENISLKSGVEVQGAGAFTTSILGTGYGSVVTANGVDSNTKLNGFTIKGGSAVYGGGFSNYSSSPTLTNLVIAGNNATYGGGISINSSSSPLISNTIIKGNSAGRGGAIYIEGKSSPIIANSIIDVNIAGMSRGGGIFNRSAAAVLVQNSVITSNSGGGILDFGNYLISDYNNVWNNSGSNYIFLSPGSHDISADPKFVDISLGDYHLQSGSPCIDAGNNGAIPASITTDIYGNSRSLDGNEDGIEVVDMGAAEYLAPLTVKIDVPSNGVVLQDVATLQATTTGAKSVEFSVREAARPDTPIGYDNLAASPGPTGTWQYLLTTNEITNGYYIIIAVAKNSMGNEATSAAVSFSIRNLVTIELLPATPVSKAGRTIPVKFELRVDAIVDPLEPFVHNESLEIRIYMGSTLLQTSHYGISTTDYRIIDTDQFYITNFKTGKTPATYTVKILRAEDFVLSQFTFKTVK